MDKPDSTNENWLQQAVKLLKGKGIITRDKDVADKTGYSKESVSNMLSGNSNISHKFKTKFEEVFGSLESIEGKEDKGKTLDYSFKYITRLEKYAELQDDVIKLLKEENQRLKQK